MTIIFAANFPVDTINICTMYIL